jgi:hypothetical protein
MSVQLYTGLGDVAEAMATYTAWIKSASSYPLGKTYGFGLSSAAPGVSSELQPVASQTGVS